MSQNTFDDKSTLVWVNAWCRQVTSHYLSQCWPRTKSTYSVIKPRSIKLSNEGHFFLNETGAYVWKTFVDARPYVWACEFHIRINYVISYLWSVCPERFFVRYKISLWSEPSSSNCVVDSLNRNRNQAEMSLEVRRTQYMGFVHWNIGSDNGLELSRWQAIIWTNDNHDANFVGQHHRARQPVVLHNSDDKIVIMTTLFSVIFMLIARVWLVIFMVTATGGWKRIGLWTLNWKDSLVDCLIVIGCVEGCQIDWGLFY